MASDQGVCPILADSLKIKTVECSFLKVSWSLKARITSLIDSTRCRYRLASRILGYSRAVKAKAWFSPVSILTPSLRYRYFLAAPPPDLNLFRHLLQLLFSRYVRSGVPVLDVVARQYPTCFTRKGIDGETFLDMFVFSRYAYDMLVFHDMFHGMFCS